MVKHCLPHIPRLRAAGTFGKAVEALFDVGRETNGKHRRLRYTSIARWCDEKAGSSVPRFGRDHKSFQPGANRDIFEETG
jgi:hypothetical protein